MEGVGEYRWPDGKVYNGQFKADKREGEGRLRWLDGKVYRGSWLKGK